MTRVARPLRNWRSWRRALLVLFAAIVVLPPVFSALFPDRPAVPVVLPAVPTGEYLVYVADWGYHTSVIVEQPPGSRLGPTGRETARFVEFAWGDRRFYMESDHRPHALFAALLLPTEAVTYVAAWDSPPEMVARPRALLARTVTAAELHALITALERSIRRADATTPVSVRVQPFASVVGYSGRFYPAYGRYLWWDDCNRWTVERLASGGLARGGRGVFFSGQVEGRLIGFRRVTPKPAV